MQEIIIKGPKGDLQLQINAHQNPKAIALIAHPNSIQGGSNKNKVVQTINKTLNRLGCSCYCPNFRGVEKSQGSYDHGVGEVSDLECVLEFAKSQNPKLPLILAGFSFGGFVSSYLALKVEFDLLILVGAAFDIYERNVADHPADKIIIIHGEDDEIVSLQSAMKYGEKNNTSINVLPKTSHFFHSKLILLASTIEDNARLQNILNRS